MYTIIFFEMSECPIHKFIDEIHLRPAIWDSMSNESSNKQLKSKAWEELCYIFFENFDQKETPEKSECSKYTLFY